MPTLSISNAQLSENDNEMIFTISLSQASLNEVQFDFQTIAGTAYGYYDYGALVGTGRNHGVIQAGQTSTTIAVSIYNDSVDEVDENFFLKLSNAVNATFVDNQLSVQATGTILDNRGSGNNLALFVSNPTFVEDNAGASRLARFEVTLSRPQSSVTSFAYATADGSAKAGQDYVATNGTVTFQAGQTTATVFVPVTADTTVENTENFSLVVTPTATIANHAQGAVGIATILDDDAGGTLPTMSVQPAADVEGNDLYFAVTLSKPTLNEVRFSYRVVAGTATGGSDYYSSSNTQTGIIAAGATSLLVKVNTYNDSNDERDENLTLEITNPTNAVLAGNAPALRGNGVIRDTDGSGTNLAVFVSNPIFREGNVGANTQAQFEVTLSQPFDSALTFSYSTADGTAVAGRDYTGTSGTLTFQPGQTTATVTVAVPGDRRVEGNQSFILSVTPSGPVDTIVAGTATIVDDDAYVKDGIVWRNQNGELNIWTASSTGFDGKGYGVIGSDWINQPGGDFSGDGTNDLLWRNTSGNVNVWTANNTAYGFTGKDYGPVGSDWKIQETGDYTGDGRADILWRNDNGTVNLWTNTGSGFNGNNVGGVSNDWTLQNVGAGDFDGDGRADPLWRNTNGAVNIWTTTNNGFSGKTIAQVDNSWKISAVGDFDGNGQADIAWRNTSGQLAIWAFSGQNYTTEDFGTVGTEWKVQKAADLNADGKSDLVWRNDNGGVAVWTSAGTDFDRREYSAVSPTWKIVG